MNGSCLLAHECHKVILWAWRIGVTIEVSISVEGQFLAGHFGVILALEIHRVSSSYIMLKVRATYPIDPYLE